MPEELPEERTGPGWWLSIEASSSAGRMVLVLVLSSVADDITRIFEYLFRVFGFE